MTLVRVNNPLSKSIDGMMKDFFNEFPSTVSKTVREDVLHFPPVNITETPTSYLLEVAVPGFIKSDFKIHLDAGVLTISTERTEEAAKENNKVIRREYSTKAFKRSFTVDEKIESENISARYENGILMLELPKKEQVRAGAKEINIQ